VPWKTLTILRPIGLVGFVDFMVIFIKSVSVIKDSDKMNDTFCMNMSFTILVVIYMPLSQMYWIIKYIRTHWKILFYRSLIW